MSEQQGAPDAFSGGQLAGLEFTAGQVERTVRQNHLLSIELETTYACNLRCIYCYSSAGQKHEDELALPELVDVIGQAHALGAQKVVLLGGGEPCLDPRLRVLIDEVRQRKMGVEVFTNGTLIDEDLARFFFDREVAVVVKVNSSDPGVQDYLAGVPDSFASIHRGLGVLKDAGYPDAHHALGVQTVICQPNLKELDDLWRWVRRQSIQPYFEVLTEQGRCEDHTELLVPPDQLKVLFERLADIDRTEFDIHWTPQPPIAGHRCQRHLYSILVRANGEIQPCVGVPITLGHVGHDRLDDIIANHPVVQDLRNVRDRVKGPCRSCALASGCYGCRGNAYHLTGDYLESDYSCWRCQTPTDTDRNPCASC